MFRGREKAITRIIIEEGGDKMKPTLTPDIIAAASMDAGDRSMRKGNRKAWNKDDYNAARDENIRLWKILEPERNIT